MSEGSNEQDQVFTEQGGLSNPTMTEDGTSTLTIEDPIHHDQMD
jgi:hypothetical protein